MAESLGLATASVTTTAKKKRFRPRKFIQKLLRSRGSKDNNDNNNNGSATNRQDAPVTVSTTLNTTPTYEPPSPSKIGLAPMIKSTTAATTSSASTSESSVSPGSPKIVDPGHLDKSSPTKSLSSSTRETVRDVIQAKKSPIKAAPAYSQAVVDWGKFPASRKDDVPFDEQTALAKDYGAFLFYADAMSNGDVEVDVIYEDLEQRRKKERQTDPIPTQVTIEKPLTPSPPRPVDPAPVKLDSVDLSFESEADHQDSSLQWVVLSDGTLEMRENPDEKEREAIVASKSGPQSMRQPRGSPMKAVVSSADERPFVGQEVKRVKDMDQEEKRVKDAKQEVKRVKDAKQEVKRVNAVKLEVKREKNADQEVKRVKNVDQEVRETRNLLELSGQSKTEQLDQERKKIDPPTADQARLEVLTQEARRKKIEQEMSERKVPSRSAKETTSMEQPTVQEEKKEQEDDGNPIIPLAPKILVQKSRTTSPAPTPSDPASVRRITSLASNVNVAQPTQQLANIKEDPAPFWSDDSFMAVGEDSISVDGSYRTVSPRMMTTQVLETDEGTEMFSTFSSTYSAFQDEEETDSNSDFLNEQEPQEEDESSLCSKGEEGDSDRELLQKSEPSKLLDPPGVVNSKGNKPTESHRVSSVSSTEIPESSPGKQVAPSISSQEIMRQQQVAQIRAAAMDRIMKVDGPKGSRPRRIMGRSLESVEAEQQHGSLTPDVPIAPVRRGPALWSPYSYDTDDADDEMGPRSVVSTPGTETDASSFASSSFMRSGYGDDGSYVDDASSYAQAHNPRRSGYTSDYTEDDAEDAETTINIGSELTEMATELRVKGPAVLMDWLDLR